MKDNSCLASITIDPWSALICKVYLSISLQLVRKLWCLPYVRLNLGRFQTLRVGETTLTVLFGWKYLLKFPGKKKSGHNRRRQKNVSYDEIIDRYATHQKIQIEKAMTYVWNVLPMSSASQWKLLDEGTWTNYSNQIATISNNILFKGRWNLKNHTTPTWAYRCSAIPGRANLMVIKQ